MKKEKIQIVFNSIYSRITDFQLQSEDVEFFNEVEELREKITQLEEGFLCKRKNVGNKVAVKKKD